MLKLFQQIDLLQQMQLLLLFKIADLDLFNGNQLSRGEIKAFENLATGSSAHYLSDLLSKFSAEVRLT
jgi:hypothetical protein